MFLINSPLEQFNIIPLIPITIGGLDFSITNAVFFMLLNFFVYYTLFNMLFVEGNGYIVPNRYQTIIEEIYDMCLGLIKGNVGENGKVYFPFVFVLFIFVLGSNLLGMIPYAFTTTSHIVITFTLGFTIYIGVNIIGVRKWKIQIFRLFLPSGVGVEMAPLLIFIESISYLSRVVSLSLRLFANMMAGHTLLKVIAGFAWGLGTHPKTIFWLLHFFPMILLVVLMLLEFAVAMIQAFVITVLCCSYLADVVHLAH